MASAVIVNRYLVANILSHTLANLFNYERVHESLIMASVSCTFAIHSLAGNFYDQNVDVTLVVN